MESRRKYTINKDKITYRIVDNEAVILNLDTGEYYSLDATGTFIWKLLEKKAGIDELSDKVANEYGISEKEAMRDLKSLIKDLVLEEMVLETAGSR